MKLTKKMIDSVRWDEEDLLHLPAGMQHQHELIGFHMNTDTGEIFYPEKPGVPEGTSTGFRASDIARKWK